MENVTERDDLDTAKVGDGASYCLYTDRHAGTIIKRTPKTIIWQRDKAKLLNGVNSYAADKLTFTPGGFCGHTDGTARYEYTRDQEGATAKFTLRTLRNGKTIWKRAGQPTRSPGLSLIAGRSEKYDFNF